MRVKEAALGKAVWYALANEPREKAEITEITSDTHAQVKIVTGPLTGIEIEVPWGILQLM
jgi:hypothetical protein